MNKGITFGKYIHQDSFVHRLDPRTKLVSIFLMIALLFANHSTVGYMVYTIILLLLSYLSKISLIEVLKSLKAVSILLIFTFVFRFMITPGTPMFEWGFLSFTEEGLAVAIRMTFRIGLMILFASLLSFTTTPKEMADGFEKMAHFNYKEENKKYNAQVTNISIMVMIAFRFIPILMDEVQNIQNAQISRGAEYENAGVIARTKHMANVALPLFLSVLDRASDLGNAIDARGYDENVKRTRLYPLIFSKDDKLVISFMLVFFIINLIIIIVTR